MDPWGQWSPSQDYSSSECSGWFGETESRSRRLCTRDQGLPSAFRRNGRSAASSPGCSYQIFGSQFEVIFLLHYSVTSVSDCFCFSMGVTDSCYTCFYFWNLCYIFFLFQKFFCIQYGGGRLLFRELSSSSDGSSAESEPLVKDTCLVQQGQSSWI